MKVVVIKTNGEVEVVELPKEHDYRDIAKLTECDTITCVERLIKGKAYDIWLDDEGLLKDKKYLTGYCNNAGEVLVGNLLIANHDEEGNTTGLSEEEIKDIMKCVIDTPSKYDGKFFYDKFGYGVILYGKKTLFYTADID